MTVAGGQLAPGVADADDRAPIEHVVRITLVLDPAAMEEAVLALAAEPFLAAAVAFFPVVHSAAAYKTPRYARNNILPATDTGFGMPARKSYDAFFRSIGQP
jgi:hypothetical protein